MEKIELKKSIEREKALLTLAFVLTVLAAPSFLISMPQVRVHVLLLVMMISATIFKRIKRLNYKLSILSK
ncbi:hypothetical protein [Pseudobdellovibrio exovorus]|uniref:Uncharacterized protein n=1 Tax=Pseudobdellovibrio exovorus JSS TaxID=1184267 RepID=M4VAP0_9BACT|nr:hypothetical protein [Pseudobdellovibrio exovorus]AGH95525.1 hypothetical protein A11Q_1309 [Pseudobdellovibrio exovorus JSS]